MTEYTPTTEEVREAFQGSGEGYDFRRVYAEQGEHFDRWLAAHDRKVADAALSAISASNRAVASDQMQPSGDVREAVARALWLHANTDREGDLPDYEPDEDDMRWFSVAADAALSAIPKPRVSAEQVERRLIGEWHEGQCACREFDGDDLDSCASTPRFRMVAPMAWTVEDVLRAAGIEVAE